nr:hypothetical protein [Brevundimonas huaxiensis]
MIDSPSSLKGVIPRQERMIGIERQAVGATALDGDALAACPVEGVGLDRVTGRTEGAQAIHRREGRAALLDGYDVIDVFGYDFAATVFARLTERGF